MEIQDDVGLKRRSEGSAVRLASADALATDLVKEFNAAVDTGELVRLIMLRAVIDTRSDRGVISWIDGNEMVVAGCYDPFGELVAVGSRWPLAGEQVTQVALAVGRPEAGSYDDVVAPEGISPALRRTYAGLRHLLVAPVRVGGLDIAMLCVSRRRSEQFTVADSDILDAIAVASAHPLRAARLEEQLNQALSELTELAAQAASVEIIKTDILRLASHELRSPLTVLHGYLSLVREGFYGDIPEPLGGVMKILQRRVEDMNNLVNDMLVAARVQDLRQEAGDVTDVRELLSDAAAGVMPRASARHRLLVDLPPDPVPALVEPDAVVLALRNIIDNAVKYSPNGGDVRCDIRADAGVVRIRVSDSGLGIDPADRDKLFTRFGRVLTTANSHIPGIGLGLYFSREVARRHGGDVALVDGDAPGSVFELSLPLAR